MFFKGTSEKMFGSQESRISPVKQKMRSPPLLRQPHLLGGDNKVSPGAGKSSEKAMLFPAYAISTSVPVAPDPIFAIADKTLLQIRLNRGLERAKNAAGKGVLKSGLAQEHPSLTDAVPFSPFD